MRTRKNTKTDPSAAAAAAATIPMATRTATASAVETTTRAATASSVGTIGLGWFDEVAGSNITIFSCLITQTLDLANTISADERITNNNVTGSTST